jgi:murein DD-endopeptidase MepM/ murein hydrolase activator NlpD
MSLRELGADVTSEAPLTRRQLRELEQRGTARPVASAPASYAVVATPERPMAVAPPARPIDRPAAVRPSAARPPVKRRAVRARDFLSVGAMLFAGALLIGMSVPANAFMTNAGGTAPLADAEAMPGQSVAVSDDVLTAAVSRDSFEVVSWAQRLAERYGNAGTFTATSGAIRWPFPYSVPTTDGFGPRPEWVSGTAFHNGVDFTPGNGTPIYAIADGVVALHAEDQWGFGNHVIIQHSIPGQNVESLYAHMQTGSSPLQTGDVIKVGDFIGLVGDTGNSYGAHLHFEVHIDKVPVDPFAWLTANAV